MSAGTRTALLLLVASLVARCYVDPPESAAPTRDYSLVIGWMQALDAKNSGQTCFCADSSVRVLLLDGKPAATEVGAYKEIAGSRRVNVTTSGKIYDILERVDAHIRTAGDEPRWIKLSMEASACVQICDLKSKKQSNYSLSAFTSNIV